MLKEFNLLNYAEIKKRAENNIGSIELNITILRNIIIEPIVPYLQYLAGQADFKVNIIIGEYDNIYKEAFEEKQHILTKATDFVFVFCQLESLSPKIVREFTMLNSSDDIDLEKQRIHEFVGNVIAGIRKKTSATIIWNSFELPYNPALGILDSQSKKNQLGVILELNDFLQQIFSENDNIYLLDLNVCLSRIGVKNFYDQRYWLIGRSPYRLDALRMVAWEQFKIIRAEKGKNKKCLVLDCDNTLWGGIVGEDGIAGIKLGKTFPGNAYYEFQQEILNLYNRGIILAVCSKNNEKDVLDVFRNHPDMILREKHIAVFQINWDDKITNLRSISEYLNIGLDSIVFIDDNEFEINLVKHSLPKVETILLPKEKHEFRDLISSCGLFDTLFFLNEDRNRGSMYKAEHERKKMAIKVTDLQSYYKLLEMIVTINKIDEFSIPRIAQLIQRTNQFNLTGKRFTELEIKAMAKNNQFDIIYIMLKDRFGDLGIVGTAIIKYVDNYALFENILLSCRVLGRGVEDLFLCSCIEYLFLKGCNYVVGQYYLTSKNSQVKDFFIKNGFELIEDSNTSQTYKLMAYVFNPIVFNYFKEINLFYRMEALD